VSPVQLTAQKAFEVMLRDQIAPALRDLGLKGSGQEFSLPSSTHWALLGFQRDKWSNRASVRFTVNVVVVARDVWDKASAAHAWMGARPHSRASGYTVSDSELPGYWYERIGLLMPRHDDYWWEVGRSTDTRRLATEVVTAIGTHVLPAMRQHMALG
jgi:uncharacterized protein DUF4304